MSNPYHSGWEQPITHPPSLEGEIDYSQENDQRIGQPSFSYSYPQQASFTPPAPYPSSSSGYASNISPMRSAPAQYVHSPLSPQHPAVSGGYPITMSSSYSSNPITSGPLESSSDQSLHAQTQGPVSQHPDPQIASRYVTASNSAPVPLSSYAVTNSSERSAIKRSRPLEESAMEDEGDHSSEMRDKTKPSALATS
jgi:hypothetical protein